MGLSIKTLVSVILLIYLYSILDFSKLFLLYEESNSIFIFWSCLLIIFIELFITARLKMLIQPLTIELSLVNLFKINLVSKFYALFLPSGIGYSIVRWYKVTNNKNNRLNFAIVTIIEKVVFLIISALFVGLPLLVLQGEKITQLQLNLSFLLPVFIIGLLLVLIFLISSSIHDRIKNINFFQRFGYFKSNPFKDRWDLILKTTLYTLTIQTLIVLRIILLFYSAGLSISFLEMIWAGSFAFVVQTLPLSIAGIGLREFAFVVVLSTYGIDPEFGVFVGSLFFAQMMIVAIIGGMIELINKSNRGFE